MFRVKWNAFSIALLLVINCFVPLFTSCGGEKGSSFYDFAEPIIVNVGSSGSGSSGGYLKIDLTLKLDNDNFVKVSQERVGAAEIRHYINELLGGKTAEELTPEKVAEYIKNTVEDKTDLQIQQVLFRTFVRQ